MLISDNNSENQNFFLVYSNYFYKPLHFPREGDLKSAPFHQIALNIALLVPGIILGIISQFFGTLYEHCKSLSESAATIPSTENSSKDTPHTPNFSTKIATVESLKKYYQQLPEVLNETSGFTDRGDF